ncbi:hypothetical protein, partial [Klebsiella michiganensis]|uniref:hypothetical protein n=1 Tax=Klebsiella michiganensis TaxID=1134687 RepID=UPI001C7EE0B1
MLRICPGYASSAPEVMLRLAGKKPQQCHVTAYSPGCGVNALPGLRVTSNLRFGSPAKRSASREEAAAMPRHGIFPGLRRKRLTRACMITPSERTGQFSLMAVRMPCPGLGFRACSV